MMVGFLMLVLLSCDYVTLNQHISALPKFFEMVVEFHKILHDIKLNNSKTVTVFKNGSPGGVEIAMLG